MAYFDSEKNKAIWQKRLSTLEKERDRRKLSGYKPTDRRQVNAGAAKAAEETKPGVRIITYEELVAKEEAKARAYRERARELSGPQMQQTKSKAL